MSYNVDAQIFETQIVIENTTQPAGVTSGSIINKGSLSTLDTYVTGHTVINNVKITPNLNDIIYEQQATLTNNTNSYTDISNFYFDNSVSNSFKAIINVTVSTADAKHAVWEINGLYKPTGWVITSSFTGDLTGVQFSMTNKEGGIGQVQYINSNTSGTTIIRYRATTTAPPGSTPLGVSTGIITNTSGPFVTNNLVYANATNNLATTDIGYVSNVLRIGGASRIVGENASSFVNFSNGGAITSMGDASVAKKMIVGEKIGVAITNPAYSLDISGDINFTGNFYKNGSLYSGSEIWGTNGTNVFYTSGNVGLGTPFPTAPLHVVGTTNSTSTTVGGIFMGTGIDNQTFIQMNSTTGNYIDFSGLGDDYKGRILYNNTSNYLEFSTNTSAIARMDSTGSLTMTGDVTSFGSISDIRFKENIESIPLDIAADKVQNLRPVTFKWKDTIHNAKKRGESDAGFIAQEVEQVVQYAVGDFEDIMSGESYKKINHERIIPYLVGAIQLLQQKVENLEKRCN